MMGACRRYRPPTFLTTYKHGGRPCHTQSKELKQSLPRRPPHQPILADRFGPQVLANPVGVSPALLTADNYLMMGRRNASVAYYPGRIHPFAGALDPQDSDVFAAVRRELKEELAFEIQDVTEIFCTGI